MFKYFYDYEVSYNGQYCTCTGSSTMVIKVILIHTTCIYAEVDYCHFVSMYA